MKRRRKLILLALVLVVVLVPVCAFLLLRGPPDPIYDGKPLSYWLSQHQVVQGLYSAPATNYTHIDANAIPFLVQAIQMGDSPYADLWPILPGLLKSFLPEPRDTATIRKNALFYLFDLEAFNSPMVVRAVARTIERSGDAKLKWLAADFLRQGHSKDPVVIQALVHGLGDIDPGVRIVCTSALRQLNPIALPNAASK